MPTTTPQPSPVSAALDSLALLRTCTRGLVRTGTVLPTEDIAIWAAYAAPELFADTVTWRAEPRPDETILRERFAHAALDAYRAARRPA